MLYIHKKIAQINKFLGKRKKILWLITNEKQWRINNNKNNKKRKPLPKRMNWSFWVSSRIRSDHYHHYEQNLSEHNNETTPVCPMKFFHKIVWQEFQKKLFFLLKISFLKISIKIEFRSLFDSDVIFFILEILTKQRKIIF